MASLSTPPIARFTLFKLGCTALFLLLEPWHVQASPPTVQVNSTSIIGTLQTSANDITVEFFRG